MFKFKITSRPMTVVNEEYRFRLVWLRNGAKSWLQQDSDTGDVGEHGNGPGDHGRNVGDERIAAGGRERHGGTGRVVEQPHDPVREGPGREGHCIGRSRYVWLFGERTFAKKEPNGALGQTR